MHGSIGLLNLLVYINLNNKGDFYEDYKKKHFIGAIS
jgi:hypothetical protein